MQMAAISDKAALKSPVNYKWNSSSESEEDDGLNYYNTFYRKYDAQIGRFTGVDMLAEKFAGINPYQFGGNNPVMFNDPSGAKYAYMDANGTKWHHADPFADIQGLAGQAYQEGFGIDGFGGILGSSGGGGGPSSNASGDYFRVVLSQLQTFGLNPGSYYFNKGEGQYNENPILIFGSIKDGQWQTNREEWYKRSII
jgi:RHS repeat-associated protein